MSDPAFYRETAKRARRLASETTDPVLQANLLTFAAAYEARAAAIATRKMPTKNPVALPDNDPVVIDALKKKLRELRYPFPKALKGKTKSWLEREIRLLTGQKTPF